MRALKVMGIVSVFTARMVVGRLASSSAVGKARAAAPASPYATMLHAGIVVRDLEKAVERWRAMGFTDSVSCPQTRAREKKVSREKQVSGTEKRLSCINVPEIGS